jgi:hypothetical protein
LIAIRKFSGLQIVSWLCLLSLTLCPQLSRGESGPPFSLGNGPLRRSAGSPKGKLRNVSALLVSDIHFDPIHDPSKVQPLVDVALVNPSSAILENCRVVTASNQSGAAATWSAEYDYAGAYGKTQFSPSAVRELIADFASDRDARMEASRRYICNYFAGGNPSELKPFWSQYVCALANHTAQVFVRAHALSASERAEGFEGCIV